MADDAAADSHPVGAERLARVVSMAQEACDFMPGASRLGNPVEVHRIWGRLAFTLYLRMRSHLEAVRLLVGSSLPEEAAPLVRSMVTESLILMELERSDDRLGLAYGYFMKSLSENEGLATAAVAASKPGAEEWVAEVRKQRAELQRGMQARGVAKPVAVPNKEKLAKDHDRESNLWDLHLYSTILHRADFGAMFRSKVRDDESMSFAVFNHDPDVNAGMLAGALQSALFAQRAVAPMFGWTEPSEELLNDRLEQIDLLFPDEVEQPAEL